MSETTERLLAEALLLYVSLDNRRRAGCAMQDADWCECYGAAQQALASVQADRTARADLDRAVAEQEQRLVVLEGEDVTEDLFDGVVHDIASEHASAVNNRGVTEQLRYIAEQGGVPWLVKAVDDVLKLLQR